jgi:DNA-binding HxlR family transcriptional regulator
MTTSTAEALWNAYADTNASPRRVIAMMANKWKLPILIHLYRVGTIRFRALQRLLPGVSQKVLTESLRSLEGDGFLRRTTYPVVPAHVEYTATPRAFALLPILVEISRWENPQIVGTIKIWA